MFRLQRVFFFFGKFESKILCTSRSLRRQSQEDGNLTNSLTKLQRVQGEGDRLWFCLSCCLTSRGDSSVGESLSSMSEDIGSIFRAAHNLKEKKSVE